jgi:acyl-coenzyme A synthetase/AMP-(fatty) acid ligase
VEVAVVADGRTVADAGAAGELYVGGPTVARGYVNRPDETKARFVDVDGRRMYRTGDRVEILADGTLRFAGRVDDQMKIRGYRVEPREVEAALRSDARVTEAVVVAVPDRHGNAALCAAAVLAVDATSDALRRRLEAKLSDYMVPREILVVDAVPKLPSGKVDRSWVAGLFSEDDEASRTEPREPADPVLQAYREILGVPDFAATDDFFAAGGNSLLAVQLIARLEGLGFVVPPAFVFIYPSPAELTDVLPAVAAV